MTTYIGVDPGSCSGCIAMLTVKDNCIVGLATIEFSKMTTYEWYKELKDYSSEFSCRATLEKVHGMPGMSTVAVSSFMRNVGHIEMALLACEIPFIEVTPQSWMKYYGLKKDKEESKTEWKRRLREHLQRILPEFKATNDTADAMLIAYYNWKTCGEKA